MRNCFSLRVTPLVSFAFCGLMSVAIAQEDGIPWPEQGEPARAFLHELREMRYYDMAVQYLDMIKDSETIDNDFREIILYERGKTLVEGSRLKGDIAEREADLDEARKSLEEFTTTNTTSKFVSAARNELANMLIERARINIQRSKATNINATEKQKMMTVAREMFDEAYGVFSETRESLKGTLETIQRQPLSEDNPRHKRLIEVRNQYRTDYLQARLLLPAVKEEKADTYPDGSEEKKKLLEAAITDYKEASVAYRTRMAGLYAKMYLGRCYVKLKDYKEALSYFTDLLEQDDSPDFKDLKKKTAILAVDCWFNDDQTKYADAINRLKAVLNMASPREAQTPDWLFLRFSLAKAYKAYADDLSQKANPTNEDKRNQTGATKMAETEVTFVTRHPSDYQVPARKLLAEWGGNTFKPDEKGEPTNFVEAKDAGKETLDDVTNASARRKVLQADIEAEQNVGEKAKLQAELQAVEKVMREGPQKALDYFNLALELADSDTSDNDMNVVRYFLSYLYYTQEKFYEAAVVGDFLARRYPDARGARQSAKIAMAAYLKLYKDEVAADEAADIEVDASFEAGRITDIADYIIQQWDGQPEAVEAAKTLIVFMVKAGELDLAKRYLGSIPSDSTGRGIAELQVGQAMWSAYLRDATQIRELEAAIADAEKEKVDNPDPARVAEITTLITGNQEKIAALQPVMETRKKDARDTLEAGVESLRAHEVDAPIVTGALSLSQLYVDIGEEQKALELLQDKTIGPYSLCKQKHPATQRQGFEVETYKVTLRAFMSSLTSGDQASKEAAKNSADEVIKRLSAKMGGTPEGKKQLVLTFIGLANDLRNQMTLITEPANKKVFAEGVASFLEQVSQDSDEVDILTWAADSLAKLGDGFGADKAAALKFYQKAIVAFENILVKAEEQGTGWLAPDTRNQVQMRLAETRLNVGGQANYQKSLAAFKGILEDRNSSLNVQIMAAQTYHAWAKMADKGNKTLFERAIVGYYKDERETVNGEKNINYNRNTLWGYLKLVQVTVQYPQFKDQYYQSLLGYARTMLDFAKFSKSKKHAESAQKSIRDAEKASEGMGGPDWKPQFDALKREIAAYLK